MAAASAPVASADVKALSSLDPLTVAMWSYASSRAGVYGQTTSTRHSLTKCRKRLEKSTTANEQQTYANPQRGGPSARCSATANRTRANVQPPTRRTRWGLSLCVGGPRRGPSPATALAPAGSFAPRRPAATATATAADVPDSTDGHGARCVHVQPTVHVVDPTAYNYQCTYKVHVHG